ncbi:anthrone oxygenase family protein [Streptomyces abyssomicinicus]|uniref:anthrone oxygenase family protein n=1 Tax=Streptomyces abyssomicinicus TaxID=574929 RepID=UPI0013DF1713|nr:anthrone oxygenase family protein [Streptomyces abyssomicinicus]
MTASTRLVRTARWASLLGGGLYAGGALATLVLELAVRSLDGPAYVEFRQATHVYFPWLIGALLVPTYAAVVMLAVLAHRAGSLAFRPAVAALVLLVLALVVSFAFNAPVNVEQTGWNPQDPPADWADIRDHWQIAHAVRTAFCLTALGCLGSAVIDRPFGGVEAPGSR